MTESSWLEWLQQLDLSIFEDLGELDWTDLTTYSLVGLAVFGALWTTSKNMTRFLWTKTEPLVGFIVSTVVVFSLWYSLLRVHASISFNLDKELFDNYLWLSAILFTPYYLIHYRLLRGFLLTLVRSLELIVDLLIFSWFPQRAERNRAKWRDRVTNAYRFCKSGIAALGRARLQGPTSKQVPAEVDSSEESASMRGGNETKQDIAKIV